MERMISRLIVLLLVFVFTVFTLQSCSTVSTLSQDPDFHEGFRRGWNSTAPKEYHY